MGVPSVRRACAVLLPVTGLAWAAVMAPASGATSDQLEAALLTGQEVPSMYQAAPASATPSPEPEVTVSDPACRPLVRSGEGLNVSATREFHASEETLPPDVPSEVDVHLDSGTPAELDTKFDAFDAALQTCKNFSVTTEGTTYQATITGAAADQGLSVRSSGYRMTITVEGQTINAAFIVARALDDTVVAVTALGDDPSVLVPYEFVVPQIDKVRQVVGGIAPEPGGSGSSPQAGPTTAI
ncbi:hypothetical protein [Yinghuangia seranimata]|uniref:hypothetical protein n=1 Tax=Yinghuangia seranimata TaxID=408067 RepID=UPI00248B3D19|nr:hypothetical protein [Yinghuangia seranimata]MDI2132895.1 hypothetical protein [Yinghuangia seranimata]